MNKEEWEDYKKLSGQITEKLDNTSTYESWLIIQEYIDRCQQENKELKKHIEKYEHYCKTTGIEELMKENKKYKEVINKSIKYISSNNIEVLKYHDIPSETTSYEIVTVDLLKILKEVE